MSCSQCRSAEFGRDMYLKELRKCEKQLEQTKKKLEVEKKKVQNLEYKVRQKYYRGMPKEVRLKLMSELKSIRDCGEDIPYDYQYLLNNLIIKLKENKL